MLDRISSFLLSHLQKDCYIRLVLLQQLTKAYLLNSLLISDALICLIT